MTTQPHFDPPANIPATLNKPAKARRFTPSLPPEIPETETRLTEAQINTAICNCESEAAYYTALAALEPIAKRLEQGGGHYWINGKLCRTLDQVVSTLLEIPT